MFNAFGVFFGDIFLNGIENEVLLGIMHALGIFLPTFTFVGEKNVFFIVSTTLTNVAYYMVRIQTADMLPEK